jgi:isoleucyl-tRNA synthetase
VKEVRIDPALAVREAFKPNLRLLGPRLGAKLPAVRAALAEGRFERRDDGSLEVEGELLSPDEFFVERSLGGSDHASFAEEDGLLVVLDTEVTPELELEGRALDWIRRVNVARKEAGLEITDRIRLRLPDEDVVAAHGELVMAETLAVELEPGELRLEKA